VLHFCKNNGMPIIVATTGIVGYLIVVDYPSFYGNGWAEQI